MSVPIKLPGQPNSEAVVWEGRFTVSLRVDDNDCCVFYCKHCNIGAFGVCVCEYMFNAVVKYSASTQY